MKQEEVQKAIKEGKAEFIKSPEQLETPDKPDKQPQTDDMAKFIAVLEMLRRPKYHLTDPPDFTPKTFLEQIQFYDDEVMPTPDRRIYFYVNNDWSYITLT
jgi:hypothetical protein